MAEWSGAARGKAATGAVPATKGRKATPAARATRTRKAAPDGGAAPTARTTHTTTPAESAEAATSGTSPQAAPSAGDDQARPTAAKHAAKGETMAKPADTKTSAGRGSRAAPPRQARSAADTEKIRVALAARRDELRGEYDQTLSEIAELQRDRLTDSAGDDQADTGTKTFEREQEITLANSILERINQVERALERLEEGNYGWCERCGSAIPVERLAAFPSATLCVSCKQLEERR